MGRTGPKNLGKMGTGLKARGASVRKSAAKTRTVRPGAASTGYRPSAGGGSGTTSSSTPMARATGQKQINKPKTSARVSRSGRLPKPHADFPGKI